MAILADPALVATVAGAYALLFALAGSHKLRAPLKFRATLDAYRLLPDSVNRQANTLVAGLLPLTELAIALNLMHPQWRATAGLGAALLLVLYAAAMAVTLWRGRAVNDCGCSFGQQTHPVQWHLVWRNLLLALPALLLATPAAEPARALSAYDLLTVLLAITMASVLYALANTLLANHGQQRGHPHD